MAPVPQVTVNDDGTLSLTTAAGVTHPPIGIADVEALAARLEDAGNALQKVAFTFAVRTLTDVLLTQGGNLDAEVSVGPGSLSATVDADTFAAVRQQLHLNPNDGGALILGPVTILQRQDAPPPDPAPDPTSDPAPDPAPDPSTSTGV